MFFNLRRPWKGQQNEPNPAVMGMTGMQQGPNNAEPQGQPAAGIFSSRGAGKSFKVF